MKNSILEAAFAGLLHDIGKFGQRTISSSDLSSEDLFGTTSDDGHMAFLHTGYTSKFIRDVLSIDDDFKKTVCIHHLPVTNDLHRILARADAIASGIDCIDELKDEESIYQTSEFITKKLNSVFTEVDFGKDRKMAWFDVSALRNVNKPQRVSKTSIDASVSNYRKMYEEMIRELKSNPAFQPGKISKTNYDILYALFQEYCSLIPSSTYAADQVFVSLFDHLKLTSAIASCLAASGGEETFYMMEFDISGIQKFIYKIVEGSESKRGIAKALRGRSFFISLICNYVTYSILKEFDMPQANIIFNTGGGALLILPARDDTEEIIRRKAESLWDELYRLFGTDITFVYALEKCNTEELELFKTDKAISLKGKLEKQKSRKYRTLVDRNLYYSSDNANEPCIICGSNLVENKNGICPVCRSIEQVSDFIVSHERFHISYHFSEGNGISLSSDSIHLDAVPDQDYDYVDSINCHDIGNVKYTASLIPRKDSKVLNFTSICEDLLPEEDTGDRKLGILKMDVDNLGAVFAYGMNADTRSLSKYQNLSRMTENFFSAGLRKICCEVSERMNSRIGECTDNGTMFYINYAGGDDLVILGPVSGILRLALAIRKEFREYVLNDNITLSAGIQIMNPKQPIRYGALKAEEMLEKAKQRDGKNSIGLFDTALSFAEYKSVLEEADYYRLLIKDGGISRSLLYQYMRVLDQCETYDDYLSYIPRLLYSIIRNIKKAENVNDLKKRLLSANDLHDVQATTLSMKIAIMETRETNG